MLWKRDHRLVLLQLDAAQAGDSVAQEEGLDRPQSDPTLELWSMP